MLIAAMTVAFVTPPATAAPPTTNPLPDANPSIAKQCGIDVTLVLDASGSVNSSHAVEDVRTAADEFLDALKDTDSTARVLQFASFAGLLSSRVSVDDASLAKGGPLSNAVAGYYNPKPPVPSGAKVHSYRGSGSPTSGGSWSNSTSDQYTNWNQAMDVTAQDPGELVVFITDGDPTAYNFDRPGDPFPAADVGINTDRGEAYQETLNRSVRSANAVKATDARVLAIGVGSALQNQASQDRLTLISGPTIADSAAEFDIETTDVALVRDFADLAAAVRGLVLELCSPSLTIRKLAQTADGATYVPTAGWDFTVTPTVPGGTFDWVLPETASGPSATVTTNGQGYAPFQWEPDPADATSNATIVEAVEPGYTPGRPAAPDYHCEFKDVDGNTRTVDGELTGTGTASFSLTGVAEEIGTCTVWNSFVYQPAIDIVKSNDPIVGRADVDNSVVSSYTVTNPGNTPLSNVRVTDDKCGPVLGVPAGGPNVGDTAPVNGKLDPGEAWRFTCTRDFPASTGPVQNPTTNTATATGVDPAGTTVTDTATAQVRGYVPRVELTKQVDGQDAVTVTSGADVTYTYRATNTGETPLGSVTLADDTPPCTSPTRGADDPGNGDGIMAVGETWTYRCVSPGVTRSVR